MQHTSDSSDNKFDSVKITITVPRPLLKRVEIIAQDDYTTRSDIVREALLKYVRYIEQASGQLTPAEALKVLKRRQLGAFVRKTLKETDLDVDITQVS